jgi:hypothetical protein
MDFSMNNTAYLEFENQTSKVLIEEIYHPIHHMVHVILEDGYENIFFTDIETGEWIEQDLGITSLSQAVGILVGSKEKETARSTVQLTWYHENNGYKPIRFGYIKYQSGGNTFYAVFAANKRYMFTLFKKKQLWKVMSHTNLHSWNFDLDYFQEVPFILDIYQL